MANNRGVIVSNIEKLNRLNILDKAIKILATSKITSKSKELAQLLITDAYIERLNEELGKLSVSGLTAEIVQGKGKKVKFLIKCNCVMQSVIMYHTRMY